MVHGCVGGVLMYFKLLMMLLTHLIAYVAYYFWQHIVSYKNRTKKVYADTIGCY